MRFPYKVLFFILSFSAVFYWLRFTPLYSAQIILEDLGGVPWLYAAIVTLFSILVGFVLQKALENWNKLSEAIGGEVDALRDLWLWSRHLSPDYKSKFDGAIKTYLREMADQGLYNKRATRSTEIQETFNTLREIMFDMSQNDNHLMSTTFTFFSSLMEHRTRRLRYSYNHIPRMLHYTLFFAASLVISLCLLVAVKDVWLDYIFTTSIALMAFVIYLVIDDLDHPLSHGNWHVTPIEYKFLLERIENESE